jgi:hypothetical protein
MGLRPVVFHEDPGQQAKSPAFFDPIMPRLRQAIAALRSISPFVREFTLESAIAPLS